MEPSSAKLEATSDPDIPPRIWADIVSAAKQITSAAIPEGTIALKFVSADEIRRLNREFRGIDEVTDVLSFEPSAGDRLHAGDIALCWDAASRQAKANGNSETEEAIALIAHGVLHLAGYDHDTPGSHGIMDQKTRELCKLVGIEVEIFGH